MQRDCSSCAPGPGHSRLASQSSSQDCFEGRQQFRAALPDSYGPLGEPPDRRRRTHLTAGGVHVRHRPGFHSVLIARARRDSLARGWTEVPFGMECREAVEFTAEQTRNIPSESRRLVVPVGSGMTLAGILTGLRRQGRRLPVDGMVGSDSRARLRLWAPDDWETSACLVRSRLAYDEHAESTRYRGLELDPIYGGSACRWPSGTMGISDIHGFGDEVPTASATCRPPVDRSSHRAGDVAREMKHPLFAIEVRPASATCRTPVDRSSHRAGDLARA